MAGVIADMDILDGDPANPRVRMAATALARGYLHSPIVNPNSLRPKWSPRRSILLTGSTGRSTCWIRSDDYLWHAPSSPPM
jgi:hypothetical protein